MPVLQSLINYFYLVQAISFITEEMGSMKSAYQSRHPVTPCVKAGRAKIIWIYKNHNFKGYEVANHSTLPNYIHLYFSQVSNSKRSPTDSVQLQESDSSPGLRPISPPFLETGPDERENTKRELKRSCRQIHFLFNNMHCAQINCAQPFQNKVQCVV